jgi:putative transposase
MKLPSAERTRLVNLGGRPIPGYSKNTKGEKVYDDQIKDYLCELIAGDGFPYGYRKLTFELRETYGLVINKKKVYRLCKELGILRHQREVKQTHPRRLARRDIVSDPNQLWQMDVKYGYIEGTGQFFYQLSAIDVFDRSIVSYHIGLRGTAKDACRVLMEGLDGRGLPNGEAGLRIRTDNGSQFTANSFVELCRGIGDGHADVFWDLVMMLT